VLQPPLVLEQELGYLWKLQKEKDGHYA